MSVSSILLRRYFLLFAFGLTWANNLMAENDTCGFSKQARELAELIQQDPQQQRFEIVCHPLLAQAAEDKARTMADYGLVRHNLGGSPNSRLLEIGFPLPDHYSGLMGNQVEAIAGGYSSPKDVWKAFKNSPQHRQHLLGEIDFYREQQYMGVGFYLDPTAPHVEYWTVYFTHAADDVKVPEYRYIPHKGVYVVQQVHIEPDVKPALE